MEKIDINDIASIQQNDRLYYCVKSLDNGDWLPILVCQPAYNRIVEIDGEQRYITITADANICPFLPKSVLYNVIKEAIVFITSRGYLVDIPKEDHYLNHYLNEIDNISLVKDVICFPYDGEIPLDDETMQKLCLEKPVRKACLDLKENGIKTLMSSANANNILTKDKSVDESRIYIGQNDSWVIGNGYAWIMLDWEELSDTNKQYLISIKNNEFDLQLKENEIDSLRHNSELNGKKGSQDEIIKFYEYVDVSKEMAKSMDFDSASIVANLQLSALPNDDYYDLNKVYLIGHNSLNNHMIQSSGNHFRTVAIRYPMNENTTVDDVEKFYSRIVLVMINNNKSKNNDVHSLT